MSEAEPRPPAAARSEVGVVGLGHIGGAIAANLGEDGLAPLVFDAVADRAHAVPGAQAVDSVAAVGAGAAITLTSLPTPEVVDAVAREWATAAPAGAILVDLSTNLPADNRRLAERLAASGHEFVEAPLTGGAVGARRRSLVFMVGGSPGAVDRVRPMLDRLGRATFHLGPVGAGTTMKLVNSLVAFAATWSSLEALSLAAAEGLDLATTVEVVRTGGASNFYLDRVVDGIDVRDRPVEFALELAAKDADLMTRLAAGDDVPAPLAGAIAEVLRDAVAHGMGGRDWGDLAVVAEQRSGRPLRMRSDAGGED